MKTLLTTLLCLLCLLCWQWSGAQNALHFDGQDDWVQLPLTGTTLANPNPDFSISLWFQTENTDTSPLCSGSYKRLLSLGSAGNRFEIGECGNNAFNLFYQLPSNSLTTTQIATLSTNTWYHLCVIKSGFNIDVFLDNVSIFSTTLNPDPTNQFDFLRLGHWPGGGLTANQDWLGTIDEFQLYDTALPPAVLCGQRYCPLSGNEANLFAYWTFDDLGIVPGGNNTAITQITDYSAAGTNVGLFGAAGNFFSLNGPTSNFTANNAPVVFPALHGLNLEIRDYPYQNNLLTGICDGDPVHVCLDDNGLIPGPYSNVTVQWEFSDDGGSTWATVGTPSFQDFCFPVLPAEIQVPCPGNTDGFVDRKYRAISTATGPTGEQCDYVSNEYDLQICCPITGANLTVVPGGPFCEGDLVNFQVDLNPLDPFVATPGPNVTIDWCFVDPTGTTPLPAYANQTSFNYPTWTAPFPPGGTPGSYCFEAKVSNCQGKLATFQQCVTVDPQPVCGTIEGSPLGSPTNLTLLSSSPLVYEICPGNDAKLEIATPFQYCIPQWQYSFTPSVPGSWVNMGLSGSIQNTNILPGNNYNWPAGATSIFYRIQCNPLSSPSACDPCFSNMVEIQLKPTPAIPIIAGLNQVCLEDLPIILNVSNPDASLTYTWYHDGLVVGSGTSLTIFEGGCYWVEATDGCHTVVSDQHCVEVCETVAVISCPLSPNECAKLGDSITLSACDSYNTCSGSSGSALTYLWSTGATTCMITDTPAAGGTTYSVTITDPVTGCEDMAQRTVVPCDVNE
ncbi:LamG-like jellyroll fold domain-containing protein [Lewinella sp. LCG006]|uniref:LamG-like jellyroll fold domain-containing protein n=1 Tax=Lewinella sp. LCG006 TaxID=3231911 RepID=UPI003460DC11